MSNRFSCAYRYKYGSLKMMKHPQKKILSIDYGTKVTGLAYFCPGREPFPIPFDKIFYNSDQQLIKEISIIIENECIDILVLGVPYLLDGTATQMTQKLITFGEELSKSQPDIKLYYQDETLSTETAKDRMRNSPEYNFQVDLKKIDQLAAVIILEDFMKS